MSKLEQNIMASVAVIYITRRLTSFRALKAYALFLSLVGVILFASVPHVAENFILAEKQGLPAVVSFVLSAVTKTNLVVQIALAIGAVASVSLVREAALSSRQRQLAI